MDNLLLGIDIGTSSCKVALFSENGDLIKEANSDYSVYYPKEGYAEQNPNEWWDGAVRAVNRLVDEAKPDIDKIAGIGVAGQSWSAVAVDKNGNVLCNTPIWMDTRAEEICREITELIDENELFEISGNPIKPSYTLPKILWYKKYMPEVYKKTYKILQSNSFIALRLTGVFSQDVSQGYGLQCFDVKKGGWNYEVCKKLSLNPDILPDLYPCHQVVGKLTAKAAEELSLKEGIPVVAGGLDAACGTLGAGVIHNGETQEQGGQAGGMSICLDCCKADKRLILSNHVVPNKWLLQGGTTGGGGVLKWAEKEFCFEEREKAKKLGKNSFYYMDKLAEEIAPGSDGVVFLPYMAGERSPIWNKRAKGVFYGVDFKKTKAHFIRALMEGVCYSLLHNIEVAEESGAKISVMHSIGGAANSALWTQMKADVTGKAIAVPNSDTATALGAAILAGVGTNIYHSFDEAVEKTVKIRKTYLPNPEFKEGYRKNYKTYKELYNRLKDLFQKGED